MQDFCCGECDKQLTPRVARAFVAMYVSEVNHYFNVLRGAWGGLLLIIGLCGWYYAAGAMWKCFYIWKDNRKANNANRRDNKSGSTGNGR